MNLLRLALPVMLLAVLAVAAGCKGGGGLTLEEYLKRVDELDDRASERSDALDERLSSISDDTASDQERIEAAQSALPEFVSILDEFLTALEKLEPPSEVREEHEEALAAGREAAELFGDVAADVGGAESLSELDQALSILNGPEYIEADERFTNSCLALQDKADENDIDVDLDCEE